MENAPLKSSKEIAFKKAEKIEDAEEIKKPLENSKDVAIRKTKLTNLEVNSEKDAIEKMKQLAKKNGLDISMSIEEKEEKIAGIQKSLDKDGEKKIDIEKETDSDLKEKKDNIFNELEEYIKSAEGKWFNLLEKEKKVIVEETKKEIDKSEDEDAAWNVCSKGVEKINALFNKIKEGEKAEIAGGDNSENERMKNFSEKIKVINNPNDLLDLLDTVNGLQGSEVFHQSEDQKKYIKLLFDKQNEKYLKNITKTGGLRENTRRIYDLIQERKRRS